MFRLRPALLPVAPTSKTQENQKGHDMAKVTAPLLSFGADGQLARTAVYASWKGIPYTRRYVIPANPKTTKQMVTRNLFRKLQQMWLLMPGDGKAPFELNATGRPYTASNKFTSSNIKGINTGTPPTDMDFFIGSPGAKGGLPPASLVVTPGSGTLSAAVGAPQIPDDWSITQAVGIAFENQDPQTDFAGAIQVQTDASSPYALAFSGLTASTEYVVSAWLQWLRPDGTVAYSTSLTTTGTPS